MVMQTFTFSPNDVAATQRGIPPKLAATTFEALTAAIWRTRTAELELPADEEVRAMIRVAGGGDGDEGVGIEALARVLLVDLEGIAL